MKNKLPENNSIRLASLDILRGFDLFLLVFFQPVFVALARQMNMSFLDSILYQFDHEVWEGFRFWDLVMPLTTILLIILISICLFIQQIQSKAF